MSQPTDGERAYLGDAVKVPVEVYDAKAVVQGGFRDQQVRYRRAVPHPVMMGKILLQPQGPIEQVRRCLDGLETGVQASLEPIVVGRRAGGVELLQLSDGADEQIT